MDPPRSLVQEFFTNKTIFVSGASGFIGKVIVEKLLRVCLVDKIYILIRPKYNKSVEQRLETLVQSSIFDTLRITSPNFAQKIVPVIGDITLPGLGLSPQDEDILRDQVHVVFHSAATIKFNEPLDVALEINFNGTKRLLDLCLGMQQLVSFVHISTAYANSDREEISEVIYSMSNVDGHKLAHDVNLMNTKKIAEITPQILQKKPNTYTYTKALVECLLEENKEILPITIIRPSIVTATVQEPVPGWIDNFNAASGIIVSVGKGILTSIHAHEDKHVDFIPVDLLVNTTIVAAWNVAQLRRTTTRTTMSLDIPVYNCCPKNPLMYKDLSRLGIKSIAKTPFDDALRYPRLEFVSSPIRHKIKDKLYHHLPAYLLDCHAAVVGRKQQMLKVYRKVTEATEALQFFTMNGWKFSTDNVSTLFQSLNGTDQQLFPMATEDIQWQDYLDKYASGLRKYTLHESDHNLIPARKNLSRKLWMQKSMNIIFVYIPAIILIFLVISFFFANNFIDFPDN